MAEVTKAPTTRGESYLWPGFRVSVLDGWDFRPNQEVVLDAEWDTTTISQEDASPGVYFASAIIIGESAGDYRKFRFELEPIMITVTESSGGSARAADAP